MNLKKVPTQTKNLKSGIQSNEDSDSLYEENNDHSPTEELYNAEVIENREAEEEANNEELGQKLYKTEIKNQNIQSENDGLYRYKSVSN